MTSRFTNPLLVSLTSPADPKVQVLALPGAGTGPSAFSPWCGVVPPYWRLTSICLPGRGRRIGQPFLRSLPECADQIAEAAKAELDEPLILFGHSLGGLLAFEVARRIQVTAVLVAGVAPVERPLDPGNIPEHAIQTHVRDLLRAAGVEDSPLQDELIGVTAPILRNDMDMLLGYAQPEERLDCPIVAYYGTSDVIQPASWAHWTTGPATTVRYQGDHHAVQANARWFIDDIEHRYGSGW